MRKESVRLKKIRRACSFYYLTNSVSVYFELNWSCVTIQPSKNALFYLGRFLVYRYPECTTWGIPSKIRQPLRSVLSEFLGPPKGPWRDELIRNAWMISLKMQSGPNGGGGGGFTFKSRPENAVGLPSMTYTTRGPHKCPLRRENEKKICYARLLKLSHRH